MVTPDSPDNPPSIVPAPAPTLGVAKISDVVILRTLDKLPSQREKDAVFWFAHHCSRRSLEPKQIARLLPKEGFPGAFYSWASIYQVLTGRRTEQGLGILPIVEAIERYRATVDVGGAVRSRAATDYIETRLGLTIWSRAEKAYNRGKIGFIFGDSYIGKTRNLVEFCHSRPANTTLYLDMPARPTLRAVVLGLAHTKGGVQTTSRATDNIITDLFAVLDRRVLLVIDNAHRALRARGGNTCADIFDLFQQLFDVRGVPQFFSMTNEGRDNLVTGPHKVRLQQIWRRRLAPLQLPDITPEDDLAKFAAAVGLPPAEDREILIEFGEGKSRRTFEHNEIELQRSYNEQHGLGAWISLLQEAKAIAEESRRPIGWGAVLKAYCEDEADTETFA